MSDWWMWGDRTRRPKEPAPAHGIRMKKTGTTWWGAAWTDALRALSGGYSNRLERGRSYARQGRVHDLVVSAGKVVAKVTGSRPTPYRVTITLRRLDDRAWSNVVAAMASRAGFAAALLGGEMPKDVEAVFVAAGAHLFPAETRDLTTECSCPDVANPCKHVAATHYVLGEGLDDDPFLLFELRGRTRDAVLADLRLARAAFAASPTGAVARAAAPPKRAATKAAGPNAARKATPAAATSKAKAPPVTATVKARVAPIDAPTYDAWAAPPPRLTPRASAPADAALLLAQLGAPRSWRAARPVAEILGPVVRAAAERALAIMVGDQDDQPREVAAAPRVSADTPRRRAPRSSRA